MFHKSRLIVQTTNIQHMSWFYMFSGLNMPICKLCFSRELPQTSGFLHSKEISNFSSDWEGIQKKDVHQLKWRRLFDSVL